MPRVPKSIKSTRQILNGPNHILHSLYAQSEELLSIESIVKRYVDQDFSIASLKNNELTLYVAKGTIATRVRYRQRNIIASLRRAGIDINALKIKVQPQFKARQPEPTHRTLSPENAALLAESAEHIEDAALRAALVRLSKRSD